MKISDPNDFLSKIDKKTYANIEDQFGDIERFLNAKDTFNFTCDMSGKCCKNRFDNPILLSPYDTFRLKNNLSISSREFLNNYARQILGAESELPMMLLKFQGTNNYRNKCLFLRSYGCKVYEDRPTVCRMYPVGRIVDTDMNSYFFLTKTADYCKLGKGKKHTLENWLKEAEVEKYLDWNDRFNSLLLGMDIKKYKSLDHKYKAALGGFLYNTDLINKFLPRDVRETNKKENKDYLLHYSYELVNKIIKDYDLKK